MGVIVNKEQDNTKLQAKINADLRDRLQNKSPEDNPDFSENIEYSKDLKKTGKFSWVWLVLIILALISLVIIYLI